MLHTALFLGFTCAAGHAPEDHSKVLAAIRTAYDDNLAALSATGTIRFHSCDGHVGPASSVQGIDALLKGAWERRSPSRGMYCFDGANRRYENLYSSEEIIARRRMTSKDSFETNIYADRLLTDGDTTLMDNVSVYRDNKTVIHSANIRAGSQHFFRLAEAIPLGLGDPDPAPYELGRCLAGVVKGREKVIVEEVDVTASLGGVPVVKIRVDDQEGHYRITFWVDPEHGAICLQTRILAFIPHNNVTMVIQFNNHDVKWAGRGWLPFRWSVAQGEVSAGGEVAGLFVREVVVEEAEFGKKPERGMFSLEFPEECRLSDSDRRLSFGSRRVWDVKDFSPAARARATPIGSSSPSHALPEMQSARLPWGWWSLSLIFLGIGLLMASGTMAFRKVFRHA